MELHHRKGASDSVRSWPFCLDRLGQREHGRTLDLLFPIESTEIPGVSGIFWRLSLPRGIPRPGICTDDEENTGQGMSPGCSRGGAGAI